MAEKTKQTKTSKSTKETVKMSPPLKKGEIRMKKFNSTKWKDKKRTVTMISTVQDDCIIHKSRRKSLANGGWKEVMKPVMTEEYNGHMRGGLIRQINCCGITVFPIRPSNGRKGLHFILLK